MWPADPSRRCWGQGPCPYCGPVPHLLYLGPEHVTAAVVQCPVCDLTWTVQTGFGVGRPEMVGPLT